jgi:hypothetical protein
MASRIVPISPVGVLTLPGIIQMFRRFIAEPFQPIDATPAGSVFFCFLFRFQNHSHFYGQFRSPFSRSIKFLLNLLFNFVQCHRKKFRF